MEELERVRALLGKGRIGEMWGELDEALSALGDAIETQTDEVRAMTEELLADAERFEQEDSFIDAALCLGKAWGTTSDIKQRNDIMDRFHIVRRRDCGQWDDL